MTTSNDDQTPQLPEWDETTPLPTASTTTSGQDATAEMPASSPGLTSDPLAIFREASTTQMPADPFRADAGTESQAGTSGAQGSQAQAGAPADSVGTGGRTAFDPASTGESTPRGHATGCPDLERSKRRQFHVPTARGPQQGRARRFLRVGPPRVHGRRFPHRRGLHHKLQSADPWDLGDRGAGNRPDPHRALLGSIQEDSEAGRGHTGRPQPGRRNP